MSLVSFPQTLPPRYFLVHPIMIIIYLRQMIVKRSLSSRKFQHGAQHRKCPQASASFNLFLPLPLLPYGALHIMLAPNCAILKHVAHPPFSPASPTIVTLRRVPGCEVAPERKQESDQSSICEVSQGTMEGLTTALQPTHLDQVTQGPSC